MELKNVNDFIDDHNVDVTSLNKMLEENTTWYFSYPYIDGTSIRISESNKKTRYKNCLYVSWLFRTVSKSQLIDNNGQFCSIASAQNCCACNVDAKKLYF